MTIGGHLQTGHDCARSAGSQDLLLLWSPGAVCFFVCTCCTLCSLVEHAVVTEQAMFAQVLLSAELEIFASPAYLEIHAAHPRWFGCLPLNLTMTSLFAGSLLGVC